MTNRNPPLDEKRIFIWLLDLSFILEDCNEAADFWTHLIKNDVATKGFFKMSIGAALREVYQFALVTQLAKLFVDGSNQELTYTKLFAELRKARNEDWFIKLFTSKDRGWFGKVKCKTPDDFIMMTEDFGKRLRSHSKAIAAVKYRRNNFTAHSWASHSKRPLLPPSKDVTLTDMRRLLTLGMRIHKALWREFGQPDIRMESDVERLDYLIQLHSKNLRAVRLTSRSR